MTVFFVAPVPPPLNGFSVMNQAMFEALSQRTETRLFNRAAKPHVAGIWGKLRRVCTTVKQLTAFAQHVRESRHRVLYVALSGGWGQAFDAAYCLIARLAGANVFFHHHSFSYIDRRLRLTSLVFAISGRARHIVLCECMGKKLAARYGLDSTQLLTLSNAALMPRFPSEVANRSARAPGPVAIGFLSNITEDKGIFEFFDALEALATHRLDYIATIAGPVDSKIKDRFESRLAACENVTYIGGVYGLEKQAFLDSLDMLLFPTKYANEAEPVTLLEALERGVLLVAAERGCIQSMVPDESGQVVPITRFAAAVTEAVRARTSASPKSAQGLRAAIMAASRDRLILEQKKMIAILELVSNGE